MATTKHKLAEEIQRHLNGGNVGAGTKFHLLELMGSVEQVANQILKMEYMNTNIPMGDLIPSGAAIATYDNIPVVQYKQTCKATLPCFPLKLPRNIGVYQIIDSNGCEFIPMELGQAALIKSNPILSNLSGYTGYECAGMDVLFTKDLTNPNEEVLVTIRLVVMDFSQYDEWDILPLSPEYEFQIKTAVIQLYSGEIVSDKLVDSGSKEQRGVPVDKQKQS